MLIGARTTVAAIAIALFDLSGSGLLVHVVPSLKKPDRSAELIFNLLFWFAVSVMISAYRVMAIPIHHGDLIYHRSEISVQLWRIVVYHVRVVPFFVWLHSRRSIHSA